MAKIKNTLFLFTIFLLTLPTFLFSQQPDLKFQHITSADGLLSNWLYIIMEDQFGFLWFAMDKGLARYDGYQFKTYLHDKNDPDSYSGTIWGITAMHEDERGDFRITTARRGLNKFDRRADKFIRYKHNPYDSTSLSSDRTHMSYLDKSGFLWIIRGGQHCGHIYVMC